MISQNRSAQFEMLADNVILFPGARRADSAASAALRRDRQATDLAANDLNPRLLALLGICVTSAALVLSAIHVVHG